MQVKVSLHIFGSIRGYATLAKTDDITAEECAQLESYSFGQTGDSNYLDSLEKKPAIISRPLNSGRWAITRVLKGNTDDYNRQTMLFITAIISIHDWLDVLRCDVMPLLDYQRLWQLTSSEKLNPVNVNVSSERPVPSSEIREKVIPILCAIEKISYDEKVSILLDEKQYEIQVFRWLNMVLPRNYKKKFSYALRSLSDGIDVDVISLSPIASVGNSTRKVTRLKEFPSLEDSVYSSMIDKYWKKEGVPSWRFIDNCPNFNISQELPTTSKQPLISYHPKSIAQKSPISRRSITLATKAFFVLLVMAIIGIACYFVIDKIIVKKQVEQKIGVLIEESSTFLNTHKDPNLLAVKGQLDESIKKISDRIKDIETVMAAKADSRLNKERDELKDLLDKAYNSKRKYETIHQLIGECEIANLSKLPDTYPDSNQVKLVIGLKERFYENILEDAISFGIEQKINTNKNKIDSWLSHIKNLIESESENYKNETRWLSQKAPECFEEEILRKYKDVQEKIIDFKKHGNLIKASNSPIESDKKLATTILNDINDTNDKKIVPDIKIMNKLKEESITLCRDANSLIDKLKLTYDDINDVNKISEKIRDVNEIGQKIKEAMEKWPRNPQSGEFRERLKDETDFLKANLFPDDVNLKKKREDLLDTLMNIQKELESQ